MISSHFLSGFKTMACSPVPLTLSQCIIPLLWGLLSKSQNSASDCIPPKYQSFLKKYGSVNVTSYLFFQPNAFFSLQYLSLAAEASLNCRNRVNSDWVRNGTKGGYQKELRQEVLREWSLGVGSRSVRGTVGVVDKALSLSLKEGSALYKTSQPFKLWGCYLYSSLYRLISVIQAQCYTGSNLRYNALTISESQKHAGQVRSHQRVNMGEGKTWGLGLGADMVLDDLKVSVCPSTEQGVWGQWLARKLRDG